MAKAIESASFKTGNSVAVRFPKALGLAAGVPVKIERRGPDYIIRPQIDPDDVNRRMRELVAALEAIGPVGEIQDREPIEFPDRPGLY